MRKEKLNKLIEEIKKEIEIEESLEPTLEECDYLFDNSIIIIKDNTIIIFDKD